MRIQNIFAWRLTTYFFLLLPWFQASSWRHPLSNINLFNWTHFNIFFTFSYFFKIFYFTNFLDGNDQGYTCIFIRTPFKRDNFFFVFCWIECHSSCNYFSTAGVDGNRKIDLNELKTTLTSLYLSVLVLYDASWVN